jgi:hypothetical protein
MTARNATADRPITFARWRRRILLCARRVAPVSPTTRGTAEVTGCSSVIQSAAAGGTVGRAGIGRAGGGADADGGGVLGGADLVGAALGGAAGAGGGFWSPTRRTNSATETESSVGGESRRPVRPLLRRSGGLGGCGAGRWGVAGRWGAAGWSGRALRNRLSASGRSQGARLSGGGGPES